MKTPITYGHFCPYNEVSDSHYKVALDICTPLSTRTWASNTLQLVHVYIWNKQYRIWEIKQSQLFNLENADEITTKLSI